MTSALLGAGTRSRSPTGVNIGGTVVESLTLLKYIVNEIEAGNIAIRDFAVEIFQEPRAGYTTMDNRFAQPLLIQSNQFASIAMEIAPSGRVRDEPVNVNINVDVNGEPYVFAPGDFSPAEDDGGIDPNDIDDDKVDKIIADDLERAKARTRKQAKKTATPAGASAPREIIFDEDASDPT